MKAFRLSQVEMKLQAMIWVPETGPIIEIGCSTGEFARLMAAARRKQDYLGIDIQERHIMKAQRRSAGMQFKCLDILENLDLLQQAVGGVLVSYQVLEHLGTAAGDEDIDFVKAIPAGVPFIFSVPNFTSADHKRYFNYSEWMRRYKPYLDFQDSIIFMTKRPPHLPHKYSYLFKAVRREY